jgi:hypothetical protein
MADSPLYRILVVHCDKPSQVSRMVGDVSAFAHPRVLGALAKVSSPATLSDIEWSVYADQDSPAIPFRDFQINGQICNRNAEPYAMRTGYRVPNGEPTVTYRDMERLAKPLAKLDRALTKLAMTEGEPATYGHYVVRVANVMKAHAIVLVPSRGWSDSMPVDNVFRADSFGRAVFYINRQTADMAKACRVACGEPVDA